VISDFRFVIYPARLLLLPISAINYVYFSADWLHRGPQRAPRFLACDGVEVTR
jgi:hypothetical protein